MSKRNKPRTANGQPRSDQQRTNTVASVAVAAVNPPAKNPTLLAVSIVLFALWFVFLLVTALVG